MHTFDRQRDGQTDSFLIAIPRLHSVQRGENWKKIKYFLVIRSFTYLSNIASVSIL